MDFGFNFSNFTLQNRHFSFVDNMGINVVQMAWWLNYTIILIITIMLRSPSEPHARSPQSGTVTLRGGAGQAKIAPQLAALPEYRRGEESRPWRRYHA